MNGQYRDGETRNIGGVPYVRQGGQWHPQATTSAPMQPLIPRLPPPQSTDQAEAIRLENAQRRINIAEGQRRAAREAATDNPGANASPADTRQAQALIEGRIPWPTGRASTDPHWQQIIAVASAMDPNLDAATQAQRRAGILAFTGNSPGAKLVGSVNRIANHLNDLNTYSERMAGPNILNNRQLSSAAAYLGQSQEGPDLSRYNNAVHLVGEELEKIGTSSTGSVTGREEAIANLSPNQSLEARRAGIQAVISLIHGAIEPLQNQYNSSFQEGTSRPAVPWITPRSREIYQRLGDVDMSLPGAPGDAGRDVSDPGAPPVMGHIPPGGSPPAGGTPPGGGPNAPPVPGAPGGERMDQTTVHMGQDTSTDASLNTSLAQRVPDPALAGINEHVQGMLHAGTPDAEIRQYVEDRGVPVSQIPAFNQVLAWRQAHPGYQGNYSVDLDKHLVPQSLVRSALTNFGDSTPGAAAIAAGNMVAGQQIPNLVGATGGDAELARAGMGEIRNRHGSASLVGDIGGAALTYGGAQAVGRAGLNATESIAPSLFARLPAWVRAGTTAGEAEAAAAPYSAQAASNAALAPTATFAPRAIATDAGIGAYESPGNRTKGALIGAGTGAGFRGALNTGARAISPTGGDLAPAYEEGVQPTLGQRMGASTNPLAASANRAEQAFQSMPLLGGIQRAARNDAINQWQLGGFNRALRNLPDEPQLPAGTRPGTAPHAFAQEQFDTAYDRVHQRINVIPDDQLGQDLSAIRENANSTLSDASVSHFNRVLDHSAVRPIINAEPGTTIGGSQLQDALSVMRRVAQDQRNSGNGDHALADMLDDVSSAIHDNAARNSPPEAISTLNNVNRGYAMLTRIERASQRGPAAKDPGTYSPATLMAAERSAPQAGVRGRQFSAGNGLMSDYAQAGLHLGQTVGNSGTGETLLATGGAGAASTLPHFVGPLGLIPAGAYVADTLGTTPWGRSAANWLLRPNSPAIRPFTDEIRAQLQARAGIGSTIGAPGVVSLYSAGP